MTKAEMAMAQEKAEVVMLRGSKLGTIRGIWIRYSLVVLRPPSKEVPSDVVVEREGKGNASPSVGQVVRSPDKTTVEEDGSVEVLEEFRPLAEIVEGDGYDSTDEETPQDGIVDGTGAVHLLGTEGTPENGSGEEGVDAGAGEPVFLVRCADVGNLGHLVVENGGADESRYESGDHLTVESDPGWDMDVVRELEILGKVEGVGGCDIPVGLEVVHCIGVTGEPETSKQLCDDI